MLESEKILGGEPQNVGDPKGKKLQGSTPSVDSSKGADSHLLFD